MALVDLWLPILLTGLATHIFSTLAWTVLPHHRPEWQKLPSEIEFQEWLAGRTVPPGQYVFPKAEDGDEAAGEAFRERAERCSGMLVLWNSPVKMGSAIAKTLAFFFVAAWMIGYLASMAIEPGAGFVRVFRFVSSAALLTHCAAWFPTVFWFKRKMAMDLLDGLVQAAITGFIFAVLWPSA